MHMGIEFTLNTSFVMRSSYTFCLILRFLLNFQWRKFQVQRDKSLNL